jgi:hypothetical protein
VYEVTALSIHTTTKFLEVLTLFGFVFDVYLIVF